MLGKLARELRLLGIDCAYQKGPDSNQALRMAKREARILLTRNTRLKDKESVFFIESERAAEQVQQILKACPNLELNPMSRCLKCNAILIEREKASVKLKVPFYVFKTHDRFYSCPNCNKIYWRGTHYEDLKKRLNQYLNKEQSI
jgi:uncharacterized protein with PIN domain